MSIHIINNINTCMITPPGLFRSLFFPICADISAPYSFNVNYHYLFNKLDNQISPHSTSTTGYAGVGVDGSTSTGSEGVGVNGSTTGYEGVEYMDLDPE